MPSGEEPLAAIAAVLSIDALIVGATGGVGIFAVQLAARASATVVASAFREDEDYLRELGVSELLPRDGDLTEAARECPPMVSTLSSTLRPTPEASSPSA